jgi:ATP-dependent helicase/nuclease subunit A
MPVLESDASIKLPEVTVIKASAGSGKTYTLTERYVQFALSRTIQKNALRNILAITFSNNASHEMKKSVLDWLKLIAFADPERTAEICSIVSGEGKHARTWAEELIEEILSRYSDFQIRTIDSFMSTVFRASALDFGFHPEFEILLDPDPLIDYAFNLYLREAREGSARARRLDQTARDMLAFQAEGDRFHWDPAAALLSEMKRMDSKLSMIDAPVDLTDLGPRMKEAETRIRESLESTASIIESSGLEKSQRSTFPRALSAARSGRFGELIGMGMKTLPVKKPPRGADAGSYEDIGRAWGETDALVSGYAGLWARSYYLPYLHVHADMAAAAERVKKSRGKIFIGDIGRTLGEYLKAEVIPEIYFRLGERIFHFLIDEFQDTSPSQWRNLFPLIENSLSEGGSLFVVGDTKQAIYGFRQADFTIMKGLETDNPFPSARHSVKDLSVNYRSKSRVLAFAEETFKKNAAAMDVYRSAVRAGGLDEYTQAPASEEDPGYVEAAILARNDEDPPERLKLQTLMEELSRRGYSWSDIAVLAPRNSDVIRATSWLNEKGIPFISFSSLDVRRRKIAAEIICLLGFLDSPPDDLSFATFILGEIFTRTLRRRLGWTDMERIHGFLFAARENPPLYKAFQTAFLDLWETFFSGLFRSTGYLPLYDLACEAFSAFGLFDIAGDEEATLAKLLEAVKDYEGSGANSLRDFLRSASDLESDAGNWAIEVPRGADCVRAMTVHKAKGLGFPVAVVLLYGERNRGFDHTVYRGENGAGLVKLNQRLAERDPDLGALYEAETLARKVNSLNSLYVALTRAKSEMYVIGVKSDKDAYPFDILPDKGFEPAARKGPARSEGKAESIQVPLLHETLPVSASRSGSRLALAERRRGEMIHRILSFILYAEGDLEERLAEATLRAAREARGSPPAPGLAAGLAAMIRSRELSGYFSARPGRKVLTEQEFCGASGELFRMDRVIVDAEGVTLIDYKTGAEDETQADHDSQVRSYADVLVSAFPGKRVSAFLAYTDRGGVRRVT